MTLCERYCYDVVESYGDSPAPELATDGFFDLIVDKGTFDAILVEGSVASMLVDVFRMLCDGGIYLVFSINNSTLLELLLSIPELQMDCTFHEMDISVYKKASVAVCQKRTPTTTSRIDINTILQAEKVILDKHFKELNPFLTIEIESNLRQKFGCEGVSLEEAHSWMFEQFCSSLLDYSFEMFLEDLTTFPALTVPNKMNIDEALAFLAQMQ